MSKKSNQRRKMHNASRVKPIKQTHTVELDVPVPVLVAQEAAPTADVEVTLEARKEPLLRRIKAALLALIGK